MQLIVIPGLIHVYPYTLKSNKYLFCFISLFHLFIYLFIYLSRANFNFE